MKPLDGPILLVGVGNVLLGDEGAGVHVARWLEAQLAELPAGVRIVDGGTLGLDLLPLLADARSAVIVDAVDMGAQPGTVAVLRGDEIVEALGGSLSAHQVGVGDLLAVARLTGSLPQRVALVGIQPARIEVSLELTQTVRDALPLAVEVARRELAAAALEMA